MSARVELQMRHFGRMMRHAWRTYERYLDYALALPGRIAQADRKQIVLFYDEFQEIASAQKCYGDPDRLAKRKVFRRFS